MITMTLSLQDIKDAIAGRFEIELTEDEASEFIRAHQNNIEDRLSEVCWDVIQDFFADNLSKYRGA